MGDWFSSQAASGSMLVALPVALVVGLVSFFSPCVIPLMPAYLAYATGLSGAQLADADVVRRHRGRMLAGSVLFVSGFTLVFVLLGVAAGGLGLALMSHQREFSIVLGVLSIALGLAFLGLLPFTQRDVRIHSVPAVGLAVAPLLGFLFGLGWTPCAGPTLGVILTLGAHEGTALRGGLLAAAYALGLGVPFIIAGVAYERMLGAVRFIRRHQVWVTRFGGILMIALGVALITGWWDVLVNWLQVTLINSYRVGV
jgi:cytochrome c-type biogenesis protein